jgi:hypothetical protein
VVCVIVPTYDLDVCTITVTALGRGNDRAPLREIVWAA